MAEVKWIKLATGLPGNRKINQIRTLPNGDTIALMWVFLMCLAGDTNDDGLVYFTKEIPYTDEMLAEEFRMDINTVRLGLQTFQRFGMLEIVDDIICLSAWEKWQSTDRLAEIREYNRIAKQKSRAKQKALQGVNDMSMTSQRRHDTDKEEDKELDIDKEEEKKSKRTKRKAFVPPTLIEVEEYCRSRNNNVDPKKFFDYFDASGWVDSKGKPVLNWKQKVITWEGGKKSETTRNSGQSKQYGVCL